MVIKYIEEFLSELFNSLGYGEYLCVSNSDKKELCDYQINTLFKLCSIEKKNINELGEDLVNKINSLENFSEYFKEVYFCRPGYINIKISDELVNKVLKYNKENNLGITEPKKETYFVDYGGPNIAKPLHIGHLRPAIIGESLKRILKFKGYNVISDAHLGDYGLQIGQVIYGMQLDHRTRDDIDLEYLNEVYPRMSALSKSDEEVLENCRRIVSELQQGNVEYLSDLEKIKEISLSDIKRLYNFLGVDFDLWLGESDAKDFIPETIKYFEDKNLVTTSEGARVIEVKKDTDNKEMPPLIIQKGDGSYLYATTDLAFIKDRIEKYNPNYILYVVDARQGLHFEQVFRASDISGLSVNTNLEHIAFGTINGMDGKPFKTRSGETLKLDDFIKLTEETFLSKKESNKDMDKKDIDIIVNAIIKYADLVNNREKNYIFDIAKFSDITGKTGPYVLYTALRVRKILNDYKNSINNDFTNTIYNDIDRELRIKLLSFNEVVERSIELRLPSVIAEYTYDLCNILNSFYQNNNISNANDIVKNDWLNVLTIAYNVIESCLNLLGIDMPSKM